MESSSCHLESRFLFCKLQRNYLLKLFRISQPGTETIGGLMVIDEFPREDALPPLDTKETI